MTEGKARTYFRFGRFSRYYNLISKYRDLYLIFF